MERVVKSEILVYVDTSNINVTGDNFADIKAANEAGGISIKIGNGRRRHVNLTKGTMLATIACEVLGIYIAKEV